MFLWGIDNGFWPAYQDWPGRLTHNIKYSQPYLRTITPRVITKQAKTEISNQKHEIYISSAFS